MIICAWKNDLSKQTLRIIWVSARYFDYINFYNEGQNCFLALLRCFTMFYIILVAQIC